jgi:hypothetical protein
VFGFLYPDASGGSKLSLGNIFNDYYHFEFHSIATWLTSLTSFSPENVISLLGQMFLVVAPVSVILLTHVLTKNINGALFAGLLAATGWLMPAFSVNWGKFPALASLAVLLRRLRFHGYFLQGRTIYPDKCCDYVKEGDRLAFQWIQKNASEHTLFLISTFDSSRTVLDTDAGIWLDPLLGRHTNKLPFTLDWESSEEIGKICNTDAAEIYVYMGGRPYSFANAKLAQGQWTKPVFTAGRTIIYQVSGCSD